WAFSPLAQGALTGKYSGAKRPSGSRGADPQRNRFMERYLARDVLDRIDRFAQLAWEAGTTPSRLALAWCLAQPGVDAVVVGATKPEQVADDAQASGLVLDATMLARLDAL